MLQGWQALLVNLCLTRGGDNSRGRGHIGSSKGSPLAHPEPYCLPNNVPTV